ncbi:MAG: T9SS type A sorting domain-containing protein [Saprospiraceae bacterium]|nr:T9SS type A sorting domain-containing protein [Saprospiraceae bacterium]
MLKLLTFVFLLIFSVGAVSQPNRIAIRQSNGQAEFYHTGTKEVFKPHGFNYIQLVQSPNGPHGESQLFIPDNHDPIEIDDDFQRMAALGYNAVRVFVDLCRDTRCIADNNGLVPAYIQNIASLLRQAKTYKLSVMLTANWLPDAGDYSGPAHQNCESSGDFFGGNCLVMSPKGVELYEKFFTDFVNVLKNAGAPMEVIWAYELRNEFFVEYNQPPFTKTCSMVITANGKSYNMNSNAEKEKMADDALIYWANMTRNAIKSVDSQALVCVGFFTPNDPNILRENDPRIVPFKAALERSELDFFDIHAYAGFHDFQLEAENYQIINYTEKPVILGEFGTFLPNAAEVYLAAQLADHWQSDACSYGVQGFLYWTWDRHRKNVSNPDDPWAGSDAGAFIGKVLSPDTKDDPCIPALPDTNVALQKPTKASMEWQEFISGNVVDGNATQTPWIAGSDPPQWVEVDLQDRYDLQAIQIVVETGSDDPFFYTHEIQVKRSSSATYQTIHTFAAERVNLETLTYKPSDGSLIKDVGFVRVRIPQAPGWAALHELSAFIPQGQDKYDVPPPPILTYPRPSLDTWKKSPLTWKNDEISLSARVQLANDSLFADIVEEKSGITQDQYDIAHLESSDVIWWRVKQQNESGESAWSVVGKLDQMSTATREETEFFQIYPNPVQQYLIIDSKGYNQQINEVSIYTASGRKIKEFRDLGDAQLLDISNLQPGIYFLQLKSSNGINNSKFIKT